ncbi:MAG: ATP-binding protein, partial [Lachnospiraceae bacterium]|nr:ATP-binding protein [Lachnospiraceae bacterium]
MKIMQLPAKIEQWETVYEMLENTFELLEISEKTKYEIYVSAEEIFTNIASYAYDTEEGMVEISWGCKDEMKKE